MKFEDAISAFWTPHDLGGEEGSDFLTSDGQDALAAIMNDEVETDNPYLKLMIQAMKIGLTLENQSDS